MWFAPTLADHLVGLGTYRPMPCRSPRRCCAVAHLAAHRVVDQPSPAAAAVTLNAGQTVFLRLLSRRTWAFFEAFVGPQDNFLPPDNMQEHPVERIAHRTSPTNIGLALLSNLAAYDFGYITLGRSDRAHERHARHDGTAGTASGSLLQLV